MKRPVAFVVLAGVAALLASVLVYSALKKREAEVKKAMATTVEIVVAAHDLPLGTKIDASAVKMARWSRDSVPPGALTDTGAVMNSFVKSAAVENEPLTPTKLFMGEKTAGVMPLLIPPGMRAMSVPVDEVGDIAGFVLPHARVDILVARASVGTGKPFYKMVLQNVEVLAVAQEIEGRKDEPELVKVVTLLVTPQDAERLALASHEGSLRLAMRNYNDDKIVMTGGSDVDNLLHIASSPMPVIANQPLSGHESRPLSPSVQIEIMRDGKTRQSISFVKEAAIGPTSARIGSVAKSASAKSTISEADTPEDTDKDGADQKAPTAATSSKNDGRSAEAAIPTFGGARAAFAPNPKTIDVP